MRATLPAIAALAVGGLLASQQAMSRRRHHAAVFGRDIHMPRDVPLGTTLAAVAALAAGGLLLAQRMRNGSGESRSSVSEWIELDVPVSTAYNQWTQFEQFPLFMTTVESVHQLDDTHLRWRAVVAGKAKEWDAEITEQIPDKRIAWRSTGGVANSGVVTFHKISDSRTRVMLQMNYRPDTAVEKVGDVAGGVKLTTKVNLKKFKQLVESRGHETGAWRGTVQH
jgi:uncharacterized membrane protein